MTRFFYYDCNISNLVIGLLIDVPIDVAGGTDDSCTISSHVGLGARLGKGLGEEF
jgi:hypothetical protein